jgi:hypothetical protein
VRASEPQALSEALRKVDLPLERIGLEAGSLTAWLHDGLRADGLPAICIETRQASATMKTMPNKTDRNDARTGADHAHRLVSAGACEESIMPSLALTPRGPPHGTERDAHDRECGEGKQLKGTTADDVKKQANLFAVRTSAEIDALRRRLKSAGDKSCNAPGLDLDEIGAQQMAVAYFHEMARRILRALPHGGYAVAGQSAPSQ